MTHNLKILPEYFTSVFIGRKTFELRKNDRDYKIGDILRLKEYENGRYTGSFVDKKVVYILEGGQYGLEKGYCILGIE